MKLSQAKAFLETALANKGLVTCAKGFLGADAVPDKVEDFYESADPKTLDRCEAFLAYAVEALSKVRSECAKRPRNPRQKDTEEAIADAKAEKEKAANRKVAQGDPEGRERARAALGAPSEKKKPRIVKGAARKKRKAAAGISRSPRRGKS